jgi:hypothetical protein
MVVHVFDPSHRGVVNRRIVVQDKLGKKIMKPYLKNN